MCSVVEWNRSGDGECEGDALMVVLCLRAAMNLHCCFAVEANFFCPPQSIVYRMLMLRCEDELEQMEGGEQ